LLSRIQKIQKDREFSNARSKSRWPKLKAILTVLFVVTEHLLDGGKKMDLFCVGAGTFDAAVVRKLLKRLYTKHDMRSPFLARLVRLFIPTTILLHKARREIRRKLISQLPLAGKLDDVFPDCSIPIP
jgi:hypothetical protein